jgi:MFS transporter, OFA family, oxalate/formate antiporter
MATTTTTTAPPAQSTYKWVTLAGIFLVYASGTIGVSTLPLLNAQLKDQFGWTHEQITYAPSLLFLMMAAMSPFAGALMEKFSPKKILLFGWMCFTIALISYASIASLWQFMAVYVLYSFGSVCTGVIPGIFLISKWFQRRRGIATGIFTVGSSFGGIIFPRLAAYWLGSGMTWSQTALLLAGATVVCAALPWIAIRNFPEDIGLSLNTLNETDETDEMNKHVTAAQTTAAHAAPTLASTPHAATFSSLFRAPTFYLVLFITAAVWFCVTPMIQHLAFHMKDLRIDLATSGQILQILFACSIVGKLTFGWLSGYGNKKIILLIATLCMAGGSFIVMLTTPTNPQNSLLLYSAALVYGIGFSGSFTMIQLLLADEFSSHAAFAKILGAVAMFDSLAGVTGIYTLGSMRTHIGSYTSAFALLSSVGLCAALGALVLRLRERRTA